MVSAAWTQLAEACARAQDAGQPAEFWWRDDDATAPNPALRRLLALAGQARVPVSLAVIPDLADAGLFVGLSPFACVLQHGCDHRNRSPTGAKKSEFSAAEPTDAALARLAVSRERFAKLAGGRALNVLVPPWNRLSDPLVERLPDIGFTGLSRFASKGDRQPVRGLRQLDTHIDIIDWTGGRRFAGEEATLGCAVRAVETACAAGSAGGRSTIGWLTHHVCHDGAAWDFLERLFDVSRSWPGVRWINAAEFFAGTARA